MVQHDRGLTASSRCHQTPHRTAVAEHDDDYGQPTQDEQPRSVQFGEEQTPAESPVFCGFGRRSANAALATRRGGFDTGAIEAVRRQLP
jgi:hypothetical protein